MMKLISNLNSHLIHFLFFSNNKKYFLLQMIVLCTNEKEKEKKIMLITNKLHILRIARVYNWLF
jgi:hypothetical protein